VRQLRCYLLFAGALLFFAAPNLLLAQAPFDPPPFPSADDRPSPGVRGLYDPSQTATNPATPAGVEGAPPATFIAPVSRAGGAAASTVTQQPAGSTLPPQAKPIEGSEIVARIEDQVILASDVMWQVNRLIEMKAASFDKPIPADQLREVQQIYLRGMVMQLIDTKLLYADFRRTVPAENLPKIAENMAEPYEKTELPRLIKMFGAKDRPELEELLRQSGTSIKDVQRQWTEKMIAGEWIRQRTPKPKPVTHEDMLTYYQEHLAQYEFPAQVRWEELMVRFDRHQGHREAAWKALAEMGNEVWGAVVANPNLRGPVFGEVAKAKSHGFTATDGGLHDWTTLGALKCEDLNTALASLAVGQMSDGIESEQGFHIVRVLERKDAGRTPFTEAQVKIRETLEAEQREALITAELAKVRKTARVWTIWEGDLSGERLAAALDGKSNR